jgi:hypothetical protein
MSEAVPHIDRPSTNPSEIPTPIRPSSGHEQRTTSNYARRGTVPPPTDTRMRLEFPPRSYTVPLRTTARQPEPPITPLSAAQQRSGNQVPTAHLLPMPENPPEDSILQHRTARGRLLAFFGYGAGPELRERKDLMSLIWNLGFNGAQVSQATAASKTLPIADFQRSPLSLLFSFIPLRIRVRSSPMLANGKRAINPLGCGILFGL